MLMPAAVLVLMLLASIAVDSAVVWTAHRELSNRAASVANDIAAVALDDDRFYRHGDVAVDAGRAEQLLAAALREEASGGLRDVSVTELEVRGRQVTVTLSGRVLAVFGPAVPGGRPGRTIHATAVAHVAS